MTKTSLGVSNVQRSMTVCEHAFVNGVENFAIIRRPSFEATLALTLAVSALLI